MKESSLQLVRNLVKKLREVGEQEYDVENSWPFATGFIESLLAEAADKHDDVYDMIERQLARELLERV